MPGSWLVYKDLLSYTYVDVSFWMNFSGNPLGARIYHTFLLSCVLLHSRCQLLTCSELVVGHVTPAKK